MKVNLFLFLGNMSMPSLESKICLYMSYDLYIIVRSNDVCEYSKMLVAHHMKILAYILADDLFYY